MVGNGDQITIITLLFGKAEGHAHQAQGDPRRHDLHPDLRHDQRFPLTHMALSTFIFKYASVRLVGLYSTVEQRSAAAEAESRGSRAAAQRWRSFCARRAAAAPEPR